MRIFDYLVNKTTSYLDKVSFTEKNYAKAKDLVKEKKYREAVEIVAETLKTWRNDYSWREAIARTFTVSNVLEQMKDSLDFWRSTIKNADKLIGQAKIVEATDKGHPCDIQKLNEALYFYQQSQNLIIDTEVLERLQNITKEISLRQEFQKLFAQAKRQAQSCYYIEAMANLVAAKKLFSIKELEPEIALCLPKISAQTQYQVSLKQAHKWARLGDFKQGIAILEQALNRFNRADGIKLLKRIKQVESGKQLYKSGLLAEIQRNYPLANIKYEEALKRIPNLDEAKIRIATIAISYQQYPKVIDKLNGVNHPDALYLRGLAYAKQQQYHLAVQEWQILKNPQLDRQKKVLSSLIHRCALEKVQTIEAFATQEAWEEAKSASVAFLENYGHDAKVIANLEHHILPMKAHQLWQTQDWQAIVTQMQTQWRSQGDIISLHNWAIAAYYYTHQDLSYLPQLIPVWLTAIANISVNPFFAHTPWNAEINHQDISTSLIGLLENLLDQLKQQDLDAYLPLRDHYRLDLVALGLIPDTPKCGIRFNNLLILPLFYWEHQEKLLKVELPPTVWGGLYSNLGSAMAACLDGDVARAVQIKPHNSLETPAEKFAQNWLAYYEGCYYLKQTDWRQGIAPLKQAQTLIKNTPEWATEIARVCELKRVGIETLSEHLELAQFWYDLLKSPAACSYLAEYKAMEVSTNLADEKISFQQAKTQLKAIKAIDSNNPVVLDIIERVEIAFQGDEIFKLLKDDRFEDAVAKAKNSDYPQIRRLMAQMCLEVLTKGIKSGELPPHLARELITWGYELCPDDVEFQELFLGLHKY